MPFSANSWIVWLCAALIIGLALIQCIFFLIRSLKRAKAIGMSEKTVKKAVTSSIAFAIVPAFSILITVITIMPALGIPLPWLRLSIIGAITYEVPATKALLDDFAISPNYELLTAGQFVTMSAVLALGVLAGPLLSPILIKPYKKGFVKFQQKDKKWGAIMSDALFLGMIATFLGMIFKNTQGGTGEIKYQGTQGWIPVFVMLISAAVMAVMGLLIKKLKWKWLEDYALPISMLVAMALAIPITAAVVEAFGPLPIENIIE